MKPYSTPKYFSILRFLSTTYRSSKSKPKFTFATHWCLPAGRSSLAHWGREWTEFGRKVEENLRHPLHWEASAPNTPGTCYASAQYEELISLWMFPFFLLEDYCGYLLLPIKGMGLLTLEFHCESPLSIRRMEPAPMSSSKFLNCTVPMTVARSVT